MPDPDAQFDNSFSPAKLDLFHQQNSNPKRIFMRLTFRKHDICSRCPPPLAMVLMVIFRDARVHSTGRGKCKPESAQQSAHGSALGAPGGTSVSARFFPSLFVPKTVSVSTTCLHHIRTRQAFSFIYYHAKQNAHFLKNTVKQSKKQEVACYR